jgi:hypothetical protein
MWIMIQRSENSLPSWITVISRDGAAAARSRASAHSDRQVANVSATSAPSTSSNSAYLTPILENEPQRLVFDMTRVGFIDRAAARLIASTGQFLPHNQRPVIRFPGPLVRRVLGLTGLDDYCEVEK